MNRLWDPVLRDLTEAAQPRCLVEIGAAAGLLTGKLVDYCETAGAVLHSIDPLPQLDVAEWERRHPDHLVFHRGLSRDVLPEIHSVDAAYIDGDHNWFTVFHECKQLEHTAVEDGHIPPLITLHDVGWPYGRRDMYYDPENVPAADRQPNRTIGVLPSEPELTEQGMNGDLHNAVSEGTPHNGVRTAVEDFVADSELNWRTVFLPGFHGLGIAVTDERMNSTPRLAAAIESLQTPEVLQSLAETLERARLDVEIAVGRELSEQREMLEQHHRYAHQASRDIEQLRIALLSAEADNARLHQLEADMTELEQLADRLRGIEADRDEILRRYVVAMNSTSWKLTEPIRQLGILMRNLRS